MRERDGESYRWPKRHDRYAPYRVFMGTTRAEGAVQIGLGETIRESAWGRDRKYVVAFLSSGSPQEPLVEFVAADDYEQTRELVAVIRGSDGGRRMYGAGDALPAVYTERFRTQIYNERIIHPGAWNKTRRGRPRGRRRGDAQPRPDPEPTTLPDLGTRLEALVHAAIERPWKALCASAPLSCVTGARRSDRDGASMSLHA